MARSASRAFFLWSVGMLQISIASDADKLLTTVGKLRAEKLPRALRNAANELGRIIHGGFDREKRNEASGGLVGEMKKRFDRPTDFTLGSLRFQLATDSRPEVRIWLKDQLSKGTAAKQYLNPQIQGGPRARKRHENKLIAAGIMPADMYAVPAVNAPLDAYGNLPVTIINRILGDLRAAGEATPRAAFVKRKGWKKNNYFFAGGKRFSMHLRPGVYWNLNGMIIPVLVFTRSPQYSIRYPFYDIGRDIYDRYKDKVIARHMNAALSSNS